MSGNSSQWGYRMTLDELGRMLDGLEAGKYAAVPHDIFADLFPPGEPDEGARAACLRFAQQHGCRIENRPGPFSGQGEVWLVKDG
jgi:hypothetical protein